MNKLFFILFISLSSHCIAISVEPTVSVTLPGMLGNRLWAFCIAKIIAEELNFNLCCKPIWGFPNTYQYSNNQPTIKYTAEYINGEQDIDIPKIINNHKLRNIMLNGYFQHYKYLQKYTEKIRNEWLTIDPQLNIYTQDPNDIVIHIRVNDNPSFVPFGIVLPFEYYKKALSMTTYNRVFICTDEPNHPFLKNFAPYNPIIRSKGSLSHNMYTHVSWDKISESGLDDFIFISSFNKIITSYSTYSWWAAFLSSATEIYAPYSINPKYRIFGEVEEERYHYIETQFIVL